MSRPLASLSRLFVALALSWPAVAAVTTPHPIVFVTQVPVPADFTTIGSVFGNQRGALDSAFRGGDLWIRYPDGTLKNLTEAVGLNSPGRLGATAVAVRDPSPHWDGNKIIFSAVVGAPTKQYEVQTYYWQLYEISGLGRNEMPQLRKVPNQPEQFNNVSPIYGSDDRIIFTSDRPRNGERHLYPQLDEYEEAPTVTGLWSLDPNTGNLFMLNHSPSGAFTPTIDSFGRVIFTRWDHLQRDQQADADNAGADYGTFNYSDESANATRLERRDEIFPEPREGNAKVEGHRFNQFFPWQINQDGTEEETLNHVGRHDFGGYGSQSFLDDPNLTYCCYEGRGKRLRMFNDIMLQIREDPTRPGLYFGTSSPEFGTHAAGQLISMTGAPGVNADDMVLNHITTPATASPTDDSETAPADHTGLYREPLPLSDGKLVAVHTAETRADRNQGSTAAPRSRYGFRLKLMVPDGNGYWRAGEALTPGLRKSVSWWNPDVLVNYDGELWELNPVELRPRQRPTPTKAHLPAPEAAVFAEEGVDPTAFQNYLKQKEMALVVTRNVTLRDHSDRQQPFNLRVPGGASVQPKPGKVYDVTHLQFFQADQIRGIGGTAKPRPGRRVLAQPMRDGGHNPYSGVPHATAVAPDGSSAAFVPARRALTWQLTDAAQQPVVRERYWLTFQPGEVRVCASCHGINKTAHGGQTEPQNKPEGLRQLLRMWKDGMVRGEEERVFDWAERQFPDNFQPKRPSTATYDGIRYRHYPATGEYLGSKDGRVYYLKNGAPMIDVGALKLFADQARSAGY
ncbi:HzsA-related protein [Chitinimonas lacunae]|uniref:Hydrazine synthase alpha subunit middle domain-containing protein n=1 Tax=Chitinimonas lacunae TaxID=1963018 RepID=A0ABV8MS39_9NEIS